MGGGLSKRRATPCLAGGVGGGTATLHCRAAPRRLGAHSTKTRAPRSIPHCRINWADKKLTSFGERHALTQTNGFGRGVEGGLLGSGRGFHPVTARNFVKTELTACGGLNKSRVRGVLSSKATSSTRSYYLSSFQHSFLCVFF